MCKYPALAPRKPSLWNLKSFILKVYMKNYEAFTLKNTLEIPSGGGFYLIFSYGKSQIRQNFKGGELSLGIPSIPENSSENSLHRYHDCNSSCHRNAPTRHYNAQTTSWCKLEASAFYTFFFSYKKLGFLAPGLKFWQFFPIFFLKWRKRKLLVRIGIKKHQIG